MSFSLFCFLNKKGNICDTWGFPSEWLSGKESTCNTGDTGDVSSIPGSGRSPGEGNGNPFQHSCLENPMDRGALVGYRS